MIEETIRKDTRITDDVFWTYVQNKQSIEEVIKELVDVSNRIHARKIGATEDMARDVVEYTVGLIDTPEVYYTNKTRTNTLILTMQEAIKAQSVSFLGLWYKHSKNKTALEDIYLSVLYGIGSQKCVGVEGMHQAVRCIEMVRKMTEIEGAQYVYRKRELWGMSAQCEEDRISTQFRNAMHIPSGVVLPCYFSGLISAFPQCRETPKICVDLYRKTKTEKMHIVDNMHDKTNEIAKRMHSMIKNMIVRDGKVRDVFVEYVYRVYEENKDRQKLQYDKAKVKPDGFVVCMSNILTEFLLPIANKRDKAEEISPTYMDRCKYVDTSDMNTMDGSKVSTHDASSTSSAVDVNSTSSVVDGSGNDKFVTKIVYAKMLMNAISYIQLGAEYDDSAGVLERLRKKAEVMKTTKSKEYSKIVAYIEDYTSYVEYMKAVLTNRVFYATESRIVVFMTMFVQKAMRNSEFKRLPVFVVEGTLLLMKWMSLPDLYQDQEMGMAVYEQVMALGKTSCAFSALVLTHKKINVNYKQLAVHVLCRYIYTVENIPGLVHSLVNYYVEIQTAIKHTMERLNERSKLAHAINVLIKQHGYKEELKVMMSGSTKTGTDKHPDMATAYILHAIATLIDAQERGFEELKKIAMTENAIETATEEEKEEMIGTMRNTMDNAQSYFRTLEETEEMIMSVMNTVPKVFLNRMIVPGLVSMLSSSLISFVGTKAKEMSVKNKKQCGFAPAKHLAYRIKMYTAIKSGDIAKTIARDEMFRPELYKKAVSICDIKGTITQGEKAQSSLLLQRVENIQINQEEEIEWPEEYLDPLTFAPMTDPVILKTSNARIDRSTAAMILMNDPVDPFTREKLTEQDIEEDRDMKERIMKYRESRRDR